jgi:transposase InsO family protein
MAVLVTRRLRAMGIRDKPTAPASPWQNGVAERLIGSIRRECLDHIIVLGEGHLRRILKSYARYYNETRTNLALDKDVPLLARFSEPVWSGRLPSWADFITTTPELKFLVHTPTICP